MTAAAITTFFDVIADALQAKDVFGMSPEVASALAEQIVITAARRGHAGDYYYLRCAQAFDRTERNARIRAEFNGTNLRAICRQYGVGKTTVYRICRRNEHA